MDTVFESEKDSSLPILPQIQLGIHLFFCASCAEESKHLRQALETMKTGFFPPSPDFGDRVMECLAKEGDMGEAPAAPAGFSFRGWVIAGFFVLLSLSSAFFGVNFAQMANEEGSSFLIPVGITIGVVLTVYGALFIGSHLRELSSRFGLRRDPDFS